MMSVIPNDEIWLINMYKNSSACFMTSLIFAKIDAQRKVPFGEKFSHNCFINMFMLIPLELMSVVLSDKLQ